MRDEEYLSLFNYRRNAVKIVFKPHPEDMSVSLIDIVGYTHNVLVYAHIEEL